MKHKWICLLILILVTTANPRAGKRPPVPPVFQPDTEIESGLELNGSTWISVQEGLHFSLQLIDPEQRLAFIAHTTGFKIDPFASPKHETDRFLTFVLEIRNEGDESLSFRPKSAWLVPDRKKEIQSPKLLGDMAFSYLTSGQKMPPAYQRVTPALLENPRTIQPGETVAGLLNYESLSPKVDTFIFQLRASLSSGSQIKFFAPYRQAKKKRKQKQ